MSGQTFTCKKCCLPLPLTPEYFHRRKGTKTGFYWQCKKCKHAIDQNYYQRNKAKVLKNVYAYRKLHPEKRIEEGRRRYIKHKAHHDAVVKRWKKNNPKKCWEYEKRWRLTHYVYWRKYLNGWHQMDHQRNPEKWFNLNHSRRLDRRIMREQGITPMGLYKRDGGICHICQKPVKLKDFSVDHLIPRIHGGPGTWENLATAHFRCNAKRGAGKIEAQLRLF